MLRLARRRQIEERSRSQIAADAFTWAVRLHEVSGRHLTGAVGLNAASDEIDAMLSGLPVEQVREIACALALLPRLGEPGQPMLLESELNRLRCAIAWAWSP